MAIKNRKSDIDEVIPYLFYNTKTNSFITR